MKKTVILFFLACAVNAGAQSTCETRVDAHQKATTRERVNYCLVPEEEKELPGPSLVFSTVDSYAVKQPDSSAVRPTAKDDYFDAAKVAVTHSLIQTRQFPKWTDGRESEQYKREYQETLVSAPETAIKILNQTECNPEKDGGLLETDTVEETSAGLKSRYSKPGRRWIKTAVVDETPVVEQPAVTILDSVEEVGPLADQYTYEQESYAPADISAQPQENSQDIAAGTYSYAPATLNTPEAMPEAALSTSQDIPVGEYSYAPAQ